MPRKRIIVLGGDGVGPEVMEATCGLLLPRHMPSPKRISSESIPCSSGKTGRVWTRRGRKILVDPCSEVDEK